MHNIYIRFLDLFQDNKGLGKDALKFVKTFKLAVDHTDTTAFGSNEDWYPMGKILHHFGQSVSDFTTMDECLAAVRHLCAENRRQQGYEEKPEAIDEKFPQFSRFWFVFSLGVKKVHTQNVVKKLEGIADLKTVAQLEQGKMFMEGMGFDEGVASGSGQIENEKAAELKKALELLKLSYLAHCREIVEISSCWVQ